MNIFIILFSLCLNISSQSRLNPVDIYKVNCPLEDLSIITSFPYTLLKVAINLQLQDLLFIPQDLSHHVLFSYIGHFQKESSRTSSCAIVRWFFERYDTDSNDFYRKKQKINLFKSLQFKDSPSADFAFLMSGPSVSPSSPIRWMLLNLLLIVSNIKLHEISTQESEYRMILFQILRIRLLSISPNEKKENCLMHIILLMREYCLFLMEVCNLDQKEFMRYYLFNQFVRDYLSSLIKENKNSECECVVFPGWPDSVDKLLKVYSDRKTEIESATEAKLRYGLVYCFIVLALLFFLIPYFS
jgi:hypothetical protein